MQDATFNELADMALKATGQFIPASKTYLIEARLQTLLRREGFSGVDDLAACLRARPNPVFEAEITSALLTRQTWFFRGRETLEQIVGSVLPERLKQSKAGRLKIWSAGVSTGQEAYSLAILLGEAGEALRGARIDIVASDVCRQSLNSARAGVYGHFEIQRGLSVHRMLEHFDQLETGQWQASEDLRLQIGFRHHNLLDDEVPLGQFDVILCRNVLSGMERHARDRVMRTLARHLLPGGMVFLGENEHLPADNGLLAPSRDVRGAWCATPEARSTAAA